MTDNDHIDNLENQAQLSKASVTVVNSSHSFSNGLHNRSNIKLFNHKNKRKDTYASNLSKN
jgi:hypothetical protein